MKKSVVFFYSIFEKALIYIGALFISIFLSHTASSQCSSVPQVEAVVNGDFEQGYIPGSFTSDQMYVYDPANAAESAKMDAVLADPTTALCGGCNHACAWASDGRYHVANYFGTFKCDGGNYDGHPFLSEANGRYDHTQGIGGTGNYMMVDTKVGGGSTIYGVKLWEQDVTIFDNQQYYFSSWFINLTPASTGANRAQLRFVVEAFDASNVSLGITELGASPFSPAEASRQNSWEQVYLTWNSPIGAASARIGIYNQSTNITGNDVGIDDISFINGCQAIQTLASPPAPDMGVDTINLCSFNGTVTLNSGVATNAGVGRTFTWYSGTSDPQTVIVGPTTTDNTLNVSSPGTYRVCVYEPGGCSKSATIVVTESNTITLGPDETICNPNSSTVALNSTLGTASAFYSYSWQRNAAPFAGSASTNTATSIGTYTVTATHSSIAACNATDSKIVTNTNTMTTSLGANQNLCSSSTATLTSSLTGTAFTYEWLKDAVVISDATTSSYVASGTGTYTVRLIHPIAACNVTDDVIITSSNPLTPGHDNFCSGGPANLSVSPNGTCPYKWYTTASGGSPIAGTIGSCTYNPTPVGTTTYYVEDTTGVTYSGIGKVTAPTTTIGWQDISKGLTFNTTKTVVINSIDMYVTNWTGFSNLRIKILDSGGNLVGTSVGTGTIGDANVTRSVTIQVGITVPAGNGYVMLIDSYSSLGNPFHWGSGGFPYTSPGGGLSIVGGTDGNYNNFANWNITEKVNSCNRLAVTATLETPCVTPVEFLFFHASKNNSVVELNWATATEFSSSHFIIERSSDGIHFQSIGKMDAAGNSTETLKYEFTDINPFTGVNYYRLREVDIDGTNQFSDVRSVDHKGEFSFSIYPNPGHGLYSINLFEVKSLTMITVYDATGKVVSYKTLQADSDPNQQIDIRNLSSAIYYIEIKSDEGVSTQKLIKE